MSVCGFKDVRKEKTLESAGMILMLEDAMSFAPVCAHGAWWEEMSV